MTNFNWRTKLKQIKTCRTKKLKEKKIKIIKVEIKQQHI